MKVNKIKVMVIAGHTKQENITIKGEKEQQVREFKYLGAIIEDTWNIEIEINQHTDNAASYTKY